MFLDNKQLSRVDKYRTLSREEFLALFFIDDGNFVTQSISSLINSFHYIEKYKFASGLELNLSKTVGKFFNKKGLINVGTLPRIKWEEEISVVGVHHRPRELVTGQWSGVLEKLKKEISYFKSFSPTFQAKAILSKSKLLSKLTYIFSVNVMPITLLGST